MRFLCLPGAFGSADKFQVQLAPIISELTSDGTATFHFVDGNHEASPPDGFEEFFGQPPYYRFISPDDDSSANSTTDVLELIRDFPAAETPEATMRELMSDGVADSRRSTKQAIQYLYDVIERSGPFDGVIGYSEGATVAATLLLCEKAKREASGGAAGGLRCGIFFMGWPPMDPKGFTLVLRDESKWAIDVPTCHVVGSLDPYIDGSMALYNVCDPETAVIFDHAKGHTLPREKRLVKELGDTIREMIARTDGGMVTAAA
ncbi:probable FSH2 Serine hydrolase that localizes to both the nucleus and cytoplasm [Cephalotrichum gorgonifer]|uniref:Probable FSH2 Serine hydrolase that localizes to both the nucleus and cytoplasm n=1 Tax=Cephalotrichum gorgonifer TaxID=2041049 RepID=A0AAE8ST85_9PEZI|nr:probable FSH2 Serine hydrolase that localizes to both the nucleus and cytoplasm [Cephalotrichum gorgonifer]